MKLKIAYKRMVIVSVLSLLLGLLGCSGNKKYTADEVRSFFTSYYGTGRYPVYSFSLQKQDENWLFPQAAMWEKRRNTIRPLAPFCSPLRMQKDFWKLSARRARSNGSEDAADPYVFFLYPMRQCAVLE